MKRSGESSIKAKILTALSIAIALGMPGVALALENLQSSSDAINRSIDAALRNMQSPEKSEGELEKLNREITSLIRKKAFLRAVADLKGQKIDFGKLIPGEPERPVLRYLYGITPDAEKWNVLYITPRKGSYIVYDEKKGFTYSAYKGGLEGFHIQIEPMKIEKAGLKLAEIPIVKGGKGSLFDPEIFKFMGNSEEIEVQVSLDGITTVTGSNGCSLKIHPDRKIEVIKEGKPQSFRDGVQDSFAKNRDASKRHLLTF